MSDVFISYSRNDQRFVEYIVRGLEARDKDVWVDLEDIPPATEWMKEIFWGIEGADNFIFVISPDSLSSQICAQEVAHAIKDNKRLIPVFWRAFNETGFERAMSRSDWKGVSLEHWQILSEVNWILFDANDQDRFRTAFQKLVDAIEQDYQYVSEHTALQQKALEWDRRGRKNSDTLRGDTLKQHKNWIESNQHAQPQSTQLQIDFIQSSQLAARRRLTTVFSSTIVALLIICAAIVVAVLQFQGRIEQQGVAESEATQRADAQSTALVEATQRIGAQETAQFEATSRAIVEAEAASEIESRITQQQLTLSRQLISQSFEVLDTQYDLALLLSVEAYNLADTVESRSHLLSVLQQRSNLITYFHGYKGGISAISSDGILLATEDCSDLREDGLCELTEIIIWNTETKQPVTDPFFSNKSVGNLLFEPNGRLLASGGLNGGSLVLWDVETGQPSVEPIDLPDDAISPSLAFSPDGKTLAFSPGFDQTIFLQNTDTGEIIDKLIQHDSPISSLMFSPDGRILASGSIAPEQTIILWDTLTRKPVGPPLSIHNDEVTAFSFSYDSKLLLSGGRDQIIALWDIDTGQLTGFEFIETEQPIANLEFFPDGTFFLSASPNGIVTQRSIFDGEPVSQIVATGNLPSFSLIDDQHYYMATSQENAIAFWDMKTKNYFAKNLVASREVMSLAFNRDGSILASGDKDGNLQLWNTQSGEMIDDLFNIHDSSITDMVFGFDNETIISSSLDNAIITWDIKTGKALVPPLLDHNWEVTCLALSPDGNTLASGSRDTNIILWDLSTEDYANMNLTEHTTWVRSIEFSPSGDILASGSAGGEIILWDVDTGTSIYKLSGHNDDVTSIAFSPDGRSFASGGNDHSIILWDIETKQMIRQIALENPGPETIAVMNLHFSSDGKTLISTSYDKVVLWDIETGQKVGEFPDQGKVAAFSTNTSLLASVQDKNNIILQSIKFEALAEQACYIANRNLTQTEWEFYIGGDPYRKTCPDLQEVVRGSPEEKPTPTAISPSTYTELFQTANSLLSSDPELALLLALEASRTEDSIEARKIFFNALYTYFGGYWPRDSIYLIDYVKDLAFSPDGKLLAVAACPTCVNGGLIEIIDLESGLTLHLLEVESAFSNSVIFSLDSQMLISGNSDGTIRFWDLITGQEIGERILHPDTGQNYDEPAYLEIHPDGNTLVSSTLYGGQIYFWDINSRRLIQHIDRPYPDTMRGLKFSPDGQTLITGYWSHPDFWDVASGEKIYSPSSEHYDFMNGIALSPNGTIVATGNADNNIGLWNATTGEFIDLLFGHTFDVWEVGFSPDGSVLASSSQDETVLLWDVVKMEELGPPLIGHDSWIFNLAFDPGGKVIATGDADGLTLLWDYDFESWRAHVCHYVNRDLTTEEWHQYFKDEPYRHTCTDQPVASVLFTTDRNIINKGECVTLSWDVFNATEVYYQNERVDPVGQRTECPEHGKLFFLEAHQSNGEIVTKFNTVGVHP